MSPVTVGRASFGVGKQKNSSNENLVLPWHTGSAMLTFNRTKVSTETAF